VALECVAETQYYIHLDWDETQRIGFSTDKVNITWGDPAAFAGSYGLGEDLIFLNSSELQYIGPIIYIEK
jgi:hypothetical protein